MPVINQPERPEHLSRDAMCACRRYGVEEKEHAEGPRSRGRDEAIGIDWTRRPLAPVGRRNHVGKRERGTMPSKKHTGGDGTGSHRRGAPPTVAGCACSVNQCIGRLLRARGARRSRTLGLLVEYRN